ncbi:MAG TPA: nuclease-related domain-containing protein [Caldisericia bacterium]|nr:nuclease-related domain-containing protein [Caldisericia bacterium]HPF48535.1 nuclease-related domain-containing protein [Caldisericia bacterium]HPI84595.1 nuclease-related domain-containing protein [Caldisericia bacterium]HPQ92990.1 nuclease-related domain-containing protein [Caldisericia bacterium]HRV75176.1 nuclease-related domain-containing protein [Caldisericia bacterium]
MVIINKSDFVRKKIFVEILLIIAGIILIIFSLGAIAFGLSSSNPIWLIILSGMILYIFGGILLVNRASEISIWRAGLSGQKVVPEKLVGLSNDYILINNVSLKGRNCDIDHIIIGPDALFAIESKHYNGEIFGQGEEWSYLKRGRAGGFYRGHIGNPSRQIKRSTWELKEMIEEELEKKGYADSKVWIEPLVVFTHPKTALRITDSPIPAIHVNDLIAFLQDFKAKEELSEKVRQEIVELIKAQ